MEREDLYELAEANNLKVVDTTTDYNGYPKNMDVAITGFDTYEAAERFAEHHGLQVVRLTKKDGWDLWRYDGYTNKPIDTVGYQDDNALLFFSEDDLENDIIRWQETLRSNLLEYNIAKMRLYAELYDSIKDLSDGEYVAACNGRVSTHDRYVTKLSYDNKTIAIAVMRM